MSSLPFAKQSGPCPFPEPDEINFTTSHYVLLINISLQTLSKLSTLPRLDVIWEGGNILSSVFHYKGEQGMCHGSGG